MVQHRIAPFLTVDEDDLVISFVRATGPGGQNVNKVASAAHLRCDLTRYTLPPDMWERLQPLAGSRLTKDGVIVMFGDQFRTQERNRADVIERLVALLKKAAHRPKTRRPTKPTKGSQERRLASKEKRSGVKALRQGKPRLSD